MKSKEGGDNSHVPQLVVSVRQETSQHRLDQLEGKGRQIDDAASMCNSERLSLAPRGKDNV